MGTHPIFESDFDSSTTHGSRNGRTPECQSLGRGKGGAKRLHQWHHRRQHGACLRRLPGGDFAECGFCERVGSQCGSSNGKIHSGELIEALTCEASRFSKEEIDALMDFAPVDVSGYLDYKALCYIITHGQEEE